MTALTEREYRRCVFEQPYTKKGPDQFVRGKPHINITLPGDDLAERYAEPRLDPSDVKPLELPQGASVIVRLYDPTAVSGDSDGGRFQRGDLLGEYEWAQEQCDAYLESFGVFVLRNLSHY